MNFPIEFISYKNGLHFATHKKLIAPECTIESNFIIKKFLFVREFELILVGKNTIEIWEKTSDFWELKNTFKFKDLICDVAENMILFHSGVVSDFSGKLIYKIQSSIISGKFLNKGRGFIAGIFDGFMHCQSFEKHTEKNLEKCVQKNLQKHVEENLQKHVEENLQKYVQKNSTEKSNDSKYNGTETFFNSKKIFNHKGRVFDCGLECDSIYTCADDRKIKITSLTGNIEIQEFRNYFFKILICENFLYSLNKDGFLRIYFLKDKKYVEEIKKIDFSSENLSSICVFEKTIFVGTVDGHLYKLNSKFEKEMIYGVTLQKNSFLGISESFNEKIFRKLKIKDVEIELETEKDLKGSKMVKLKVSIGKYIRYISLNNFYDRMIAVNDQKIALLSKNIVSYFHYCLPEEIALQNSNFLSFLKLNYSIKIKNISCVFKNFIGTTSGWVFTGKDLYKISESQISKICENENFLIIFDCKNFMFLIKKSEIDSANENSISLNVKDLKKCNFLFRSTKFSELCYANFTAFLEIKESINSKMLFGTKNGDLFFVDSNGILDQIHLNAEIVSISKFDDNFLISTNNGNFYFIELINSSIFISKTINLEFRIVAAKENIILLSNGVCVKICVSIDSKNFNFSRIKIGEYCTAIALEPKMDDIFISNEDNQKFFIAHEGKISYFSKKSKITSDKIHRNDIFDIAVSKNFVFTVGDDHCLKRTDIGFFKNYSNQNTISTVAHSSQIVKIALFENHIFTLSTEMRIGIFDQNLILKKYIQFNVQTPKQLFLSKNRILVFGKSIEKINFDYLN